METKQLTPKATQRLAALYKAMTESPQALAYNQAAATALEMLDIDPAKAASINFDTGVVTVQGAPTPLPVSVEDPKVDAQEAG